MEGRALDAATVFASALELPGPERARFVAEKCGSRSDLRQEVESLLRAHEAAGDFLSSGTEVGRATHRIRQTGGLSAALPTIPGYRLERQLGEGSLGLVFAAVDEKLQRRVAIKVLRPETGSFAKGRVLDEASKLAKLAHPAVVTVFSVLDDNEPPAIVMEFVEGFPLDRFAQELTFEQKSRLLREVARGLAAAHAHGLVHRDLKPENIVVGPDLRPRILDFGLSLTSEETKERTGGFAGTPLYASPEQARGEPTTTASDIFSFGSVMFKVLTGRAPFEGENLAELLRAIGNTQPPFLRDVAVGVPEDLQAICLACLAAKPEDRPTAEDLVMDLGRFLLGEPVRLRPKLYDDLLRQSISRYADQARSWQSQSIISGDEHDAIQSVHRRLLADEDHWFIDARRITQLQTILSGATWLAVVATILTVWLLRDELTPLARWLLPTAFTGVLFLAGLLAQRERDILPAATFLAGATLASAPCVLAWLAELGLWADIPKNVAQLFPGAFSNQQVLAASIAALTTSGLCWWRFRMTGFAWTTSLLVTTSYVSFLLLFNWLERRPEIQALWCLPLVGLEWAALRLERKGRVRWTLPLHLISLVALIAGLDVIALHGPTLSMVGIEQSRWAYLDHERAVAFSFTLNGLVFLVLMLLAQRSHSLDLRRAGKLLEVLALVHVLTALFVNALNHRGDSHVRADVWLYLAFAAGFVVMAPFRSHWRMLAGGLVGLGLGSYLLVDLGLVARKPFILGLGIAGLAVSIATFWYARSRARSARK